uniref:Uncharacterized protein n=1 Tax=Daucus carota subsp. sativus TaxID=79200 RepID=A0A166CMQ4_DAUCS
MYVLEQPKSCIIYNTRSEEGMINGYARLTKKTKERFQKCRDHTVFRSSPVPKSLGDIYANKNTAYTKGSQQP